MKTKWRRIVALLTKTNSARLCQILSNESVSKDKKVKKKKPTARRWKIKNTTVEKKERKIKEKRDGVGREGGTEGWKGRRENKEIIIMILKGKMNRGRKKPHVVITLERRRRRRRWRK